MGELSGEGGGSGGLGGCDEASAHGSKDESGQLTERVQMSGFVRCSD